MAVRMAAATATSQLRRQRPQVRNPVGCARNPDVSCRKRTSPSAPWFEGRLGELPSILTWADAGDALEQPAEGRGVLVADPPGDLLDRFAGAFEPALGLLDAQALHVVERRMAVAAWNRRENPRSETPDWRIISRTGVTTAALVSSHP